MIDKDYLESGPPADEERPTTGGGGGVRYLFMAVAVGGLLLTLGYVTLVPGGGVHGVSDGHGHALPEAIEVRLDTPKPAPAFALEQLEGPALTSAEMSGDLVVLDFWATWCAPCIQEIPGYRALHAAYKDRGVHFIGVTDPTSGDLEDVLAFAQEHDMTYPLAWMDDAIYDAYGPIFGIPTTFLLRPDGQIIKRWIGFSPRKHGEMRYLIDQVLDKSAVVD